MKTQIFFYSFNTKTKDGSIIATGIRVESQVITKGEMMNANLPLLCRENLFDNGVSTPDIDALKHAIEKNL